VAKSAGQTTEIANTVSEFNFRRPASVKDFLSSSSGTNTREPTPFEDDIEDLRTLKGQIGSFSDYQERAPTPVPSDDEIEEVAVDYFQARTIRQAKKLRGRAADLSAVGG
jgi:hypothetical protein